MPLKVKLKLYCTDEDHEDFETIIQDVYFGNVPYMTPKGTFVINGAERVIVSQLHRSPGVFFGQSFHANGTKLYSARVIPFKGSWIEFTTDINNVLYAYIDRKKVDDEAAEGAREKRVREIAASQEMLSVLWIMFVFVIGL